MKTRITQSLKRFQCDESGATAVEYAVMLALIMLSLVVGVGQLALETQKNFDRSGDAINSSLNR